jgi:purine-binding chemotaxis protein CheW
MSNTMNDHLAEYVTATIGGQLFGLPIGRVQDVFAPQRVTRVPLAGYEVAGVLNMRGRIVTLIDLRRQLGLPIGEDSERAQMAIGIEHRGESYGLLIDAVGEVMKLAEGSREDNPINLDPKLARVSSCVHRLDREIMVILDVDRILAVPAAAA